MTKPILDRGYQGLGYS